MLQLGHLLEFLFGFQKPLKAHYKWAFHGEDLIYKIFLIYYIISSIWELAVLFRKAHIFLLRDDHMGGMDKVNIILIQFHHFWSISKHHEDFLHHIQSRMLIFHNNSEDPD